MNSVQRMTNRSATGPVNDAERQLDMQRRILREDRQDPAFVLRIKAMQVSPKTIRTA